MKLTDRLATDFRLTMRMVSRYVVSDGYFWLFAVLFVSVLFVLQWLFSIEQFIEIFSNSDLSLTTKIDISIDALLALFKFIDDLTPVSMILIALLQSAALTLLIRFKDSMTSKKSTQTGQSIGSLSLGLIGVGCVACSGSLLTPILGVVAANVSISLAERIGDIILIIAVVLSYWSLSKISFAVALSTAEFNKS